MQPDRLLTNLRKGVVESCVLAMMQAEEVYGVDLARRLVKLGLLASEGTLYPLLARLRAAGLVTTRWEESLSGPPRRYYRLTESGSQAVAQFASTWPPFAAAVDFVLKETR